MTKDATEGQHRSDPKLHITQMLIMGELNWAAEQWHRAEVR
ncbi:hypothetical protein [Nocardia sp. NPDC046763]